MKIVGLLLVSALLLPSCGQRPERLEERAGSSEPAAKPAKVVRFSGSLVLQGELAEAKNGAVFVNARRKGQRLPSLSRKYELGDAAWTREERGRALAFELTDEHNMSGFAAPLAAEMEVEARFDPDGFIDPTPGAEDPGVVRVSVPASPGDLHLSITLTAGG